MRDLHFNSATVCRITRISHRQLNDWIKKALIVPSVPSGGRGKRYLFCFVDLIQIKTAAFLRHQGISLQKVRRSLDYIRDHFPEIDKSLAEMKFLTDGVSVFVITANDDELEQQSKNIINASRYGQLVCVFKLGEAVKDLEEEVRVYIHADQKVVKLMGQEFLVSLTPDVEEGGYVSACEELAGCFSQGETKKEALENIKLAIVDWIGEEKSARARA